MLHLLATTVLALLVAACSGRESTPPPASTPSTPAAPTPAAPTPAAPTPAPSGDPAPDHAAVADGAVLIDVRTPEEFSQESIPGSTNIPVDQVADRMGEIEKLVSGDKARRVVVFCASGRRASKAKARLEAAGYTNVVNGGGIDDMR